MYKAELPQGGVHKLRLQDEVGRWLSKCQQMSTGVYWWSVLCQSEVKQKPIYTT